MSHIPAKGPSQTMVHDNNNAHDTSATVGVVAAADYHPTGNRAVENKEIYAATRDYLKKNGVNHLLYRNDEHNAGRPIAADHSMTKGHDLDLEDLLNKDDGQDGLISVKTGKHAQKGKSSLVSI